MKILTFPQLKDNYAYVLIDTISNAAAIIDASEPKHIYQALSGLDIKFILNTHHHKYQRNPDL